MSYKIEKIEDFFKNNEYIENDYQIFGNIYIYDIYYDFYYFERYL